MASSVAVSVVRFLLLSGQTLPDRFSVGKFDDQLCVRVQSCEVGRQGGYPPIGLMLDPTDLGLRYAHDFCNLSLRDSRRNADGTGVDHTSYYSINAMPSSSRGMDFLFPLILYLYLPIEEETGKG